MHWILCASRIVLNSFKNFPLVATSASAAGRQILSLQKISGLRTMFTVCVEGNIGSGKSTFLSFFQQFTSVHTINEPVEQWTSVGGRHNALNLLYENPTRWSYLFNQYAMLSRLKQHKFITNTKFKMMERSLFSTHNVFVRSNFKSGYLSDLELEVLTEWFDYLVSCQEVHVDLFVYLRVPPDICLQRVQSRGRKEEGGLNLEFLTQLHDLYENLMSREFQPKLPAPVLELDASLDLTNMLEIYANRKSEILRGYA